jgi:primosomal protein N' (replication factor Y)
VVVTVTLFKKEKLAIIIEEVNEPKEFKALEITSVSKNYYTSKQMDIAKFISYYYFSSMGEAISLFTPYIKSISDKIMADREKIIKPNLSKIQSDAYNSLSTKDNALLFGVTGSGKTEIFISMMIDMVEEGKSSIFLMPEISLTPQMEQRLKKYFGNRVAMWHSKLTKKSKEKILEKIYNQEIDVIAGARSALFTPLANLGLIVVDEEHDDSYKSMTKPRYHARDMAVFIGKKIDARVILASATPTLNSYYKYPVIKLNKPFIQTEKNYIFVGGSAINKTIISNIRSNFNQSNQSLMFVPTRGNFKYLYCQSCGVTHSCPYCSVGMTLHRYNRSLKCHYCEYTQKIIECCASCGHHPLKSERMGTVEVKEILEEMIPKLQIEQFDRDSITTVKRLKDALKRFDSGESQLLLGTQMLSKGHDYANITLSVIMGLDFIMGLSDYRAKERAITLLIQIAGRSGRAKSANIIIQTDNREAFLPYIDNYEKFLKEEIEFRQDIYPPFVSLARVLISYKDNKKAMDLTEVIVDKLRDFQDIEIVGFGKAPIERIANKYRYNILLRSKKRLPLIDALHQVNQNGIEIDIDPVEFA